MSRLSRKNREDIIIKGAGGICDAFDDAVKETFRINDKEYDFICEAATEEELDILATETKSFGDKRKLITTLEKLLKQM